MSPASRRRVDPRERALELSEAAEAAWAQAMRGHVMAPPDDAFAERLRALAEAAAGRAQAAELGAQAGLRWVPRPNALRSQPPYELRPGTGRRGSPELWEEFDEVVEQVKRGDAGTDPVAVATAARALSRVAGALADELEDEPAARSKRKARGA